MSRKLTELEELIVSYAREASCLAELCVLVDYDPDSGRVLERWVPKAEVVSLANHIVNRKQF
jgi:hypothetical protein